MSAGTNFVRQEFCRKTAKGLWLRGRYSAFDGTIVLEYQTRVVSTGIGQLRILDAEGAIAGSVFDQPLRGSMPAEWNEVGAISVDAAPFYDFVRKVQAFGLKAMDAYGAVCRNAVTLAEHGYELGEIMPWFAAPLDGEWIVGGVYEVRQNAVGILEGMDGCKIEVIEEDRARTRGDATDCTLFYDGRQIEMCIDNAELAVSTTLL